MVDKFKEGDVVDFKANKTKGTGIIRGIANTHFGIGYSYIIEIKSGNVDKETYPYSCFVCPETCLKPHKKEETT